MADRVQSISVYVIPRYRPSNFYGRQKMQKNYVFLTFFQFFFEIRHHSLNLTSPRVLLTKTFFRLGRLNAINDFLRSSFDLRFFAVNWRMLQKGGRGWRATWEGGGVSSPRCSHRAQCSTPSTARESVTRIFRGKYTPFPSLPSRFSFKATAIK